MTLSLLFSRDLFARDLLVLNLCQSFAHKVKEKNGRQLALFGDAETIGSQAMSVGCGVVRNQTEVFRVACFFRS
jgi:hypothetical protein